MKTTTKLANAFKGFEIQNKVEIKGGARVTYTDGKGNCDIQYDNKEVCLVPDPGYAVGDFYQ